jgi:hypothetical protein
VLRTSDRDSRQGARAREQGARAPRYRICFLPSILYLPEAPPRCGHQSRLYLDPVPWVERLLTAQALLPSKHREALRNSRDCVLEPLPAFVHAENRGFLHGDCLSTRGRMSSRMPPRWDGDGEHGMAVAAGIFPQHFICAFYSYNVTTGIILPSVTVASRCPLPGRVFSEGETR